MKIFFYILKDYFRYVIGIVFLCTFLFILFDFIDKTTKYLSRYEPSLGQLIQLYFYQMPALLIQTLPIASLMGSVVTMVLLSRTNEITAMRASGMSPARIGMPLAAGGLLLSLFSLFLGEAVLPKFAENMYYLKEVVIERQSDTEIAEGAHWVRQESLLFSFKDYNPNTQKLFGLQLVQMGNAFMPTQISYAKEAQYLPDQDLWQVEGIHVLDFSEVGRLKQKAYAESRQMQLPVSPAKLRKERRPPSELNVLQLRDLIARRKAAGLDSQDFEIDMHFKISFAFASLVVSLIGLQFGYRSERTTETIKGVLLAFAVGIGYWFVMTATKTLCAQSGLPPMLGAWIPNVVILGFSVIQNFVLKTRA